MTILRMAAVAAPFGRDLEADFTRIGQIIADARAQGVRLLALPEACLGGYLASLDGDVVHDDGPPPLALDGPEIGRLSRLAGGMVVTAGYCELAGGRMYNSVVCVTGDGVLGNHRKVHQPLAEGDTYDRGGEFTAFDTPVGRLGHDDLLRQGVPRVRAGTGPRRGRDRHLRVGLADKSHQRGGGSRARPVDGSLQYL